MKVFALLLFVAVALFTKPCKDKPIPHDVVWDKELMITDRMVVDSVEASSVNGAFSIKTLLENMAPPGKGAKDMMLNLLQKWDTNQTVNSFTVPARVQVRSEVINPWKIKDGFSASTSDADWDMKFENAPFRLLAIVNRIDLKKMDNNGKPLNAGEGRFVFGVVDASGNAMNFTVILEYEQKAQSVDDVKKWAMAWHHLGTFRTFDNEYLKALKLVTGMFAGKNTMPSKPNGSSLNQVRTNSLFNDWELRELNITRATGMFELVTTAQSPDDNFNQSQQLTDYINNNLADIKASKHVIPLQLPSGQPFRGANSKVGIREWRTSVPVDPEARFRFSFNTCNACHNGETGSSFFHIFPRSDGSQVRLSRFLTENFSQTDPVNNNVVREMKEKEERIAILADLNGQAQFKASATEALQARTNRVH